MFGSRERSGLLVLGWNINLRGSFAVPSREIATISKVIVGIVKHGRGMIPIADFSNWVVVEHSSVLRSYFIK